MNDVTAAMNVLMENYFNPTASMLQHQVISLLVHINKEVYPQLLLAVSKWFQRQQERYPHKGSLVAIQMVAQQQWEKVLNLIDLTLHSLLLIPLLLDEVVASVVPLQQLVGQSKKMRNMKVFPLHFCESTLLGFHFNKCRQIMTAMKRQLNLDTLCSTLPTVLSGLSSSLNDLTGHLLDQSVTTNIEVFHNLTQVFISDLRKVVFRDVPRLSLTTRSGLIALCTACSHGELSTFAKVRGKLHEDICIRYQSKPSRMMNAVKALVQEVKEHAVSAIWMYRSKPNAINNDVDPSNACAVMAKDISCSRKQWQCLYRLQASFYQHPKCFQPWTTKNKQTVMDLRYNVFHPKQILAENMNLVSQALALLHHRQTQSMRYASSEYVALSLYCSEMHQDIGFALPFAISYINDVRLRKNSDDAYEQQLLVYHQQCRQLFLESMSLRRMLCYVNQSMCYRCDCNGICWW
jgi:hypothetical protein